MDSQRLLHLTDPAGKVLWFRQRPILRPCRKPLRYPCPHILQVRGPFRLVSRTKRSEVNFPGTHRQDRIEGFRIVQGHEKGCLNILTEGGYSGQMDQQEYISGKKTDSHGCSEADTYERSFSPKYFKTQSFSASKDLTPHSYPIYLRTFFRQAGRNRFRVSTENRAYSNHGS